MRRKTVAVWIAALAAVCGGIAATSPGTAADDPKKDAATKPDDNPKAEAAAKGDVKAKESQSKFMRQKLAASNQVLEGLVTEDFALIEKGAATMQRLGAAEQWQVSNDAMYRQQSNQFRRVMEQLQKKARDKQLEGATLSWVEGTMSCLECHKWVRSTIVAQ